MQARTTGHLDFLRVNLHENDHLQSSWNKYGEENFATLYLERCPVRKCLKREQHYIDLYQTCDPQHGYNHAPVAGSVLGLRWKLKTSTKRKIGKALRRFRKTGKRKVRPARKQRLYWKGRHHTAASKRKMSESQKRWRRTRIGQERMRQGQLGKKLSDAHKASIGNAIRGRKYSPEHCRAIGDGQRGRKLSVAQCKMIGDRTRGSKLPEETKKMIAATMKQRWQERKQNGWTYDETKRSPNFTHKGHKHSAETRNKMRLSHLKRNAGPKAAQPAQA